MLNNSNNNNIKVILCIDGGSIRNYISLQILDKIKEVINLDLCEACDLITSTSSGSIIVCSKSNKSNKSISNDKLVKQYEIMSRQDENNTLRFSSNSTTSQYSSIFNTQSNVNIFLHNSVNSTTALKNSMIQFFNDNQVPISINSKQQYGSSPNSSPTKLVSSPTKSANVPFPASSMEPVKKGLVVCVCENKVTKERVAKVYTNYDNKNKLQVGGKSLDIQRTNLPIECVFEQFQDSKNVYYDSGTIYNSSIYFAYTEAKSLFPNSSKLLIISIGSGYDSKSSKSYQISNHETNNKVEQYLNNNNNNNSNNNNNNNNNNNTMDQNGDFRNLYKQYESFINKENSFSLLNDYNQIQKEQDCFIYRFDCPINFEAQSSFNFGGGSESLSYDGASPIHTDSSFNELKDCVVRSIDQEFKQSLFTIKRLLNHKN